LRIQVRFYDCVYMSRCVACNVQLLLDDQFGKCPRAIGCCGTTGNASGGGAKNSKLSGPRFEPITTQSASESAKLLSEMRRQSTLQRQKHIIRLMKPHKA
jgi:hypothetical protein